jgi:hypothetical protein
MIMDDIFLETMRIEHRNKSLIQLEVAIERLDRKMLELSGKLEVVDNAVMKIYTKLIEAGILKGMILR